ncbi:hypothetical protein HZC07_05695 [Candidatus Micrarchaeota archaeon]|nr:hypothetical protein [Candidatus Micrarchaeota archaeon]
MRFEFENWDEIRKIGLQKIIADAIVEYDFEKDTGIQEGGTVDTSKQDPFVTQSSSRVNAERRSLALGGALGFGLGRDKVDTLITIKCMARVAGDPVTDRPFTMTTNGTERVFKPSLTSPVLKVLDVQVVHPGHDTAWGIRVRKAGVQIVEGLNPILYGTVEGLLGNFKGLKIKVDSDNRFLYINNNWVLGTTLRQKTQLDLEGGKRITFGPLALVRHNTATGVNTFGGGAEAVFESATGALSFHAKVGAETDVGGDSMFRRPVGLTAGFEAQMIPQRWSVKSSKRRVERNPFEGTTPLFYTQAIKLFDKGGDTTPEEFDRTVSALTTSIRAPFVSKPLSSALNGEEELAYRRALDLLDKAVKEKTIEGKFDRLREAIKELRGIRAMRSFEYRE